jgi:hypothetical protein
MQWFLSNETAAVKLMSDDWKELLIRVRTQLTNWRSLVVKKLWNPKIHYSHQKNLSLGPIVASVHPPTLFIHLVLTLFVSAQWRCCHHLSRLKNLLHQHMHTPKFQARSPANSFTKSPSASPHLKIKFYKAMEGRSQWPRSIRQELSSLSRTLESWVRIRLEPCMSVCVYSVFVLSCV